jgi:hypothetical protein
MMCPRASRGGRPTLRAALVSERRSEPAPAVVARGKVGYDTTIQFAIYGMLRAPST